MGWAGGQGKLEGVHKKHEMTPHKKDQKYPAVKKLSKIRIVNLEKNKKGVFIFL